ncbi:MAG: hypothetical protein MJ175_03690 [Clostridia bacterium]|nr:hypothetical protein [Clostridia bacterium]
MKKISVISVSIAALLLSASMFSCGDTPAQQPDVQTSPETKPAEVETEAVTGRAAEKDAIPDDVQFTGETVKVLYRDEDWYAHWDMIGTDNSGDVIWDAIWMRNQKVEDRFGIKLDIQPTQTTGRSNVAKEIKTQVFAGTCEYDIISSTGNTTISESLYPYLYELSDLKYLDINQPWWRTNAIEELSLDGIHYRYLMGDHLLNDYLKCGVILYNKNMYASYFDDADAAYKYVLDGTWTWDKLMNLTKEAYLDLNGDGKEDALDQYGLMLPSGYSEATVHMALSCDMMTYARTDDGGIDLSPINNERNAAIIEKLIDVCHNTAGVYVSDKGLDASPEYFASNRSMFYTGRLSNVVNADMRSMQNDYGILPMPKLDEAQEKYITAIHSSASVTCVPTTLADNRADMIGAVLEGWASEAYRTVITPFIETAMKSKYSRDALSGQVIDIVFGNATVQFTDVYGANMSDLFGSTILSPIASGKNNFSSSVAKKLTSAQKSLDKYLAGLQENG